MKRNILLLLTLCLCFVPTLFPAAGLMQDTIDEEMIECAAKDGSDSVSSIYRARFPAGVAGNLALGGTAGGFLPAEGMSAMGAGSVYGYPAGPAVFEYEDIQLADLAWPYDAGFMSHMIMVLWASLAGLVGLGVVLILGDRRATQEE